MPCHAHRFAAPLLAISGLVAGLGCDMLDARKAQTDGSGRSDTSPSPNTAAPKKSLGPAARTAGQPRKTPTARATAAPPTGAPDLLSAQDPFDGAPEGVSFAEATLGGADPYSRDPGVRSVVRVRMPAGWTKKKEERWEDLIRFLAPGDDGRVSVKGVARWLADRNKNAKGLSEHILRWDHSLDEVDFEPPRTMKVGRQGMVLWSQRGKARRFVGGQGCAALDKRDACRKPATVWGIAIATEKKNVGVLVSAVLNNDASDEVKKQLAAAMRSVELIDPTAK